MIETVKVITKKLTSVEESLYQTKARSSQDVLNFPIRLNNRLASLGGMVSAGDNRPTQQSQEVKDELIKQIDAELSGLKQVLSEDLKKFNDVLIQKKIPGVFTEGEKKP